METIPADNVQPIAEKPEIKAYIDYALSHGGDGLIVVGWLYDPDSLVTGIGLLVEERRNHLGKKVCEMRPLVHGKDNVFLERIQREDVGQAMRDTGGDAWNNYGFVLVLAGAEGGKSLAFETVNGRVVALPINPLTETADIDCALDACKPHCGAALSSGLKAVFGDDDLLLGMQEVTAGSSGWDTPMKKFSTVDHVILLDGRYLVINGWIALTADEIDRVTVSVGYERIDISHRMKRYMREDVAPLHSWPAATETLGFLCLVNGRHGTAAKALITVRTCTGDEQTHECVVTRMDWNSFSGLVCKDNNDFSLAAIQLLEELQPEVHSGHIRSKLSALRSDYLQTRYGVLGVFIEDPDYIYACVDRGIPLGAGGLFVFGWYLCVGRKPVSIKVYDSEGSSVEVELISLLRRDVVEVYREKLPDVTSMCGFVFLAPVPTRAGDQRVLAFDFGELGETWLKIPVDRPFHSGINLARDMIGMIPEPMTMSHRLYDLFDRALGPAIDAITRNVNTGAVEVKMQQFGVPPESPVCSVIVPLYGRCDFMRYQLSHFADDPEFAQCDLIYVVDDPELVNAALGLASRFQPLFGIPFRVLWYGENRGFAGANNIGVRYARAGCVVLMNSDVLPQQHGWLGTLRHALDTLDGAGAVGPLLEFADGSIQHAGMRPIQEASLPGFVLNTHPRMGTRWDGGSQPSEQVMLTAACLMLSRENYLTVGGLDEGYLVGDFEDSDLCLVLRKLGYRLWLVPAARLWHLERQSVGLYGTAKVKQLITLYNGWRYRQKILRGELVDPYEVEVMQ